MILIAPDKFKGTFTSAEIGVLIEKYLHRTHPDEELFRIEMADGGEGTAEIIARLRGLEKKSVAGYNPVGTECDATFYSDSEASRVAIDTSALVGRNILENIADYDAMDGCTNSVGKFIRSFAKGGTEEIVIGVGGTMTIDGGAGVLQEMGYLFINRNGDKLPYPITPAYLSDIHRIIPPNQIPPGFYIQQCAFADAEEIPKPRIKALIDVCVPLIPRINGELSSLSFARQKGVTEDEIAQIEAGLRNLQKVLHDTFPNIDFVEAANIGAGGGLALALKLCNALLIPGGEYILEAQLEHYGKSNAKFTHVYTGEGCLDEQSFGGKVTGTIVERFATAGVPVTIVCGRNDLPAGYPLPANVDVLLLSSIQQ